MLKEIYEQPDAVARTIEEYVRHGEVRLDGLAARGRRAAPASSAS